MRWHRAAVRRADGARWPGHALAGALAAVCVAVSACGGHASAAGGYQGLEASQPLVPPSTALRATDGTTWDMATHDAGSLRLVFFGYTHCPDTCPTTMADLASALRRSTGDVRRRTHVWFVTTDPQRDTVASMRQWLGRFDPAFVGLTGTPAQVAAAAKAFGVPLLPAQKRPGGGYDVGHGSQVLAVTPDGRVHLVWLSGTTVDQYRDDLRRLLRDRRYAAA